MERVRVSPGVSPWPWCALRKQRGRKDQCSFVGYTEEQNCGLYCEVNPLIDASAHGSLWYGWRCLEFCVANKVWGKDLCGDSCLLPTLSRFAELSLAPQTSLQGTISKCVGIMWHGRRSSTATSKNPTLFGTSPFGSSICPQFKNMAGLSCECRQMASKMLKNKRKTIHMHVSFFNFFNKAVPFIKIFR